MQIADFIIGLSGHLWLHFHHVRLVISIQTKEADNNKAFPLSSRNEEDACGLWDPPNETWINKNYVSHNEYQYICFV